MTQSARVSSPTDVNMAGYRSSYSSIRGTLSRKGSIAPNSELANEQVATETSDISKFNRALLHSEVGKDISRLGMGFGQSSNSGTIGVIKEPFIA